MKVAILDFTGVRKFPGIELMQGLGASDRAVLECCRLMPKLDHEVHLFCNTDFTGLTDGVYWHNYVPFNFACDLLIIQRLPLYYERINAKKTILWLHDDIDAPVNNHIDKFLSIPDLFIVLSNYHKERLINIGVDENKIIILPEGIDGRIDRFGSQEDRGKTLVMASAPFKSLPLLMKLWPEIKEAVPDVRLTIIGSMKLYQASDYDEHFKKLYDIMKLDPQITHYELLSNAATVELIGKHAIMCYPNIFRETFCLSAMEAISQNTPVITSALGALPETVGDCGVCIEGDPKTTAWQYSFVQAIIFYLTNKEKLKELRIHCTNRNIHTWNDIIKEILTHGATR